MGSLCLNTLYLFRGAGPLYGGHHVFYSCQTGQTKHLLSLRQLKANTGSLSCLDGEGEVRGIQL